MHVAKKYSFLRSRIRNNRDISVASSFYSLKKATSLINLALNEDPGMLQQLLRNGGSDNGIATDTVDAKFSIPTGYSFTEGSNVKQIFNLRIILQAPAPTSEGFLIYTAYPY